MALIEQGKISEYILLPSDITKIWRSTRLKDELVKHLQNLFKPKSQFEQEKVEYNHINILAEFILFNLIFAKNELMFDEFKAAMLVDMFWKLLEFDVEEEKGSKMIIQEDNQVQEDTGDSEFELKLK